MYDISINRTFWKYIQTNSWMRPLKKYYCHEEIPSLGSYVCIPPYKNHGKILEKTILVSFLHLQTSIKIINLFLV